MRISAISLYDDFANRRVKNNSGYDFNYNYQSCKKDTVSFGSAWVINRLTTATIGFVIKEGYDALRSGRQKAAYKKDLVDRFVNVSNDIKNGIMPVDVLFALANTNSEEPSSAIYSLADKYNGTFTISNLKDCALKSLFPHIKESDCDRNSGHEAKVALLNNMVDTGEVMNSLYFYNTFRNLPDNPNFPITYNYNRNKITLIEKLMKDKNVIKNCINAEHNETDAKEKRIMVITALIDSLPRDMYKSFFRDYKDLVEEFYNEAYKIAEKNLVNGAYGKNDMDFFYTSFYCNGLTTKEIGISYISDVTDISKGNCNYAQPIFEKYYIEMMEKYKNNYRQGCKYFRVRKKYFDDMVKDYNLLKLAATKKHIDEIKTLFKERIVEKMHSGDEYIYCSAAGLLNLSGIAPVLRELIANDEGLLKRLDALTEEVSWYYFIYTGQFIEEENGVVRANYRYSDKTSFLEKFDALKQMRNQKYTTDIERLYNSKSDELASGIKYVKQPNVWSPKEPDPPKNNVKQASDNNANYSTSSQEAIDLYNKAEEYERYGADYGILSAML